MSRRCVILISILGALGAVCSAYGQSGEITGIVVRETDGAPLSRVVVSLSGGGGDAVQVTGASGVFRFLAPDGEYTVTAQREGYFGPRREGVPAPDFVAQTRVSAGAEGPALRMTLSPGGVIAGRVLSPHGVPLDSVPVRAMRAA